MATIEQLRQRYPDACRMAPTYTPLITSDVTSEQFDKAREDGLKRLQEQIDSRKPSP
jgi:hypothetical protein